MSTAAGDGSLHAGAHAGAQLNTRLAVGEHQEVCERGTSSSNCSRGRVLEACAL
jgi:hypothetical protein